MTHMRIKLTVAGCGLIIAIAYLAFAGLEQGWVYHLQVDQFLSSTQYHQQRVRICGTVRSEGLEVNPGHLTARFSLQGTSANLPVVYHGTIPDLFKAGCEVVVEGRDDSTGVFQADSLMTKCASKYQSQDHARKAKVNS